MKRGGVTLPSLNGKKKDRCAGADCLSYNQMIPTYTIADPRWSVTFVVKFSAMYWRQLLYIAVVSKLDWVNLTWVPNLGTTYLGVLT